MTAAPERPARFLYLGLPVGALLLLADGRRLGPLCLSQLGTGTRRLRRVAAARGLELLEQPDLSRPEVCDALAASGHDALLSWFWTRRIPEPLLRSAPRGAFGVHPSLLPRWRGPDPYFWAIRAGDAVTGVTAHRLDAEYDTGAIVAARELPILAADDAWTLARRLDRPSLALLREVAARLERGEPLEGEPQDDALASWAPVPDEEACTIRWGAPAADLVRLVRAASPAPGAAAWLGDREVVILAARATERVPRALEPGEAVWTDEGVVVRAGDDAVVLERVAVEPLDARGLAGDAVASLLPGLADLRGRWR